MATVLLLDLCPTGPGVLCVPTLVGSSQETGVPASLIDLGQLCRGSSLFMGTPFDYIFLIKAVITVLVFVQSMTVRVDTKIKSD